MKQLSSTLILMLFMLHLSAQQLGVGFGGNISGIKYKSNGQKQSEIHGLPASNAKILLTIHHQNKKNSRKRNADRTYTLYSIGYAGARLNEKRSSISSNWMMHYLRLSMGVNRTLNYRKKVAPVFGLGISLNYLMTGQQEYGNEQFDLTSELRRTSTGITGRAGISYTASAENTINFLLGSTFGLTNIDRDLNESAKLTEWSLTAEALFRLKQKRRR